LASSNTRNAGLTILIIGLVGFLFGFVMVTGPQISYFVNKQRFKNIDNKIYGKDSASIKKAEREAKEREKAIKEGKIEKEVDESRSFSAQLHKYRTKRAEARRLGLTLEEFTEIERRQGTKQNIEKFGMADARRVIGGGIQITENLNTDNKLKVKNDGDEFDIVESVKMETLTTADQFTGVSEEVRTEAIKPLVHEDIGILGRIKNFLEEKKD